MKENYHYHKCAKHIIRGSHFSIFSSCGDSFQAYWAHIKPKYGLEDEEDDEDDLPNHSLENALVNQRLITDVFKR